MTMLSKVIFWEALYRMKYLGLEGLEDTLINRQKFMQFNLGIRTDPAWGNTYQFSTLVEGRLYESTQ